MEFALNEIGKRINIADAISGEKYICPCCKSEMIQKRGQIKIWHYAHKNLEDCVSYYDNKGEWHRHMQDLFPEENREVYEVINGHKHFFDVLTHDNQIIEFQHSPMSIEEFEFRTEDYCSRPGTKKPIWVFDFEDKIFNVKKKYGTNERLLHWSHPGKLFGDYKCWQSKYILWLRIAPVNTKYYQENGFYGFPKIKDVEKFDPHYFCVSWVSEDCSALKGHFYTEAAFEDLMKWV